MKFTILCDMPMHNLLYSEDVGTKFIRNIVICRSGLQDNPVVSNLRPSEDYVFYKEGNTLKQVSGPSTAAPRRMGQSAGCVHHAALRLSLAAQELFNGRACRLADVGSQ